ncbi:MAG TPA: NADPH-dependent FMN reductase [Polyangiaceae bacterium]|nr:NADPH-dependent FMN reductase [Polyangiaceae bacterium]
MATIIGIAGSLRKKSFNAALLRACAELAPAGTSIEIESIAGIPLYDGDVESEQGIPAPVTQLKDRIAQADGLLLVTPEYNNSMPGVLKNAIDWLTRPPADIRRVFAGKPVALLGATPGKGGTRLGQATWLPVFRTLGMRAWFGEQIYVAGAAKLFDEGGTLIDAELKQRVAAFVAGFTNFVANDTPPQAREQ